MSTSRNAVSSVDEVVAVYKKSIDRSLIVENLGKTSEERLRQLQQLQRFADELRTSGEKLRKR